MQVQQAPWCCRDPTVAASMLDTVVHMPVVVQRQVPGLVETVQKLWEFRSWHCLLDRLVTCPLACRLFWAVYTGTRPGLTPAIRAGKGVAGTPGACSQVFCHPIRCMLVRSYRQRHVRNSPVRTTTTTSTSIASHPTPNHPTQNPTTQPLVFWFYVFGSTLSVFQF